MEEADNTAPSCEELAVYMEESIVSVTSTYEQSPVVPIVDDVIIGTLGNFSASIGEAKSKKIFNVSAIVASALRNSTVLHHRSTFPDNRRDILYINTEQGRHHYQQILKRILRLAELPGDKKPGNLLMMALRRFSPELHLAIVKRAIDTIPDLGLIIIDGTRGFLYNINSPGESTGIISRFIQWTDNRQIHIHTVLHQNKNDEHAHGHIGTELSNKAEAITQAEVDREDKTINVIKAVHIHDCEFEPFAFRINEEALPELMGRYLHKEKKIGQPTKEPFDLCKEISENVHHVALDAAFTNGDINSYNEYLKRLKEGYGLQNIKLGRSKAVKVATLLNDRQMVIREGKDYTFNPEYHY